MQAMPCQETFARMFRTKLLLSLASLHMRLPCSAQVRCQGAPDTLLPAPVMQIKPLVPASLHMRLPCSAQVRCKNTP